jgi:putative copper resistance protein D
VTAGELLGRALFDLPWLALPIFGAWYLRAWRRVWPLGLRRRHSAWRLASFLVGLAIVLVAVLSPLETLGNRVLYLDFTCFLLITMIAPPLIVLGAPLTLAFRVGTPRSRARLRSAYRSRLATALSFPMVAWLLFAVITYVWQFTRLTDDAANHALLRELQLWTLLAVSLNFWAIAICADPMRWRIAYPLRALFVFVEMTHKGLFGGMFLSMNNAFHHQFAARLPAWTGMSPIEDQRAAIMILWLGGNMVFVAALIAIISGWLRAEQRNARRVDWRLALVRAERRKREEAMEAVFRRPL